MKTMQCLVVIISYLLLLGCAKPPIVWTKSNYSQQELQEDNRVCQFFAKTIGAQPAYTDLAMTLDYEKLGKRFYQECMEDRGWKKE